MAKINQEEYEVLKGLDDKWKWIARDDNYGGYIFCFREKPHKHIRSGGWSPDITQYKFFGGYDLLFQFIQWEDEEPYNIAELIKEYEYSTEHVSHVVNERVRMLGKAWSESEETEVKKNIDWLKEEFDDLFNGKSILTVGRSVVDEIINQLDEPETLSQGHNQQAYRDGFKEGERQMAEYFESITEEPSQEQVQKYLSEHGIEVVEKEPETVGSVLDDFYESLDRMKKVLSMEVEEMEE